MFVRVPKDHRVFRVHKVHRDLKGFKVPKELLEVQQIPVQRVIRALQE
jgi:hypothetical protein